MKLTYRYTVHGFSGGMMLSNTVSGEWDFDSFNIGTDLDSPNGEVKISVLYKTHDTVTVNVKYRKNEKTITVSPCGEEWFNDDANAYGFSYAFIVKE